RGPCEFEEFSKPCHSISAVLLQTYEPLFQSGFLKKQCCLALFKQLFFDAPVQEDIGEACAPCPVLIDQQFAVRDFSFLDCLLLKAGISYPLACIREFLCIEL